MSDTQKEKASGKDTMESLSGRPIQLTEAGREYQVEVKTKQYNRQLKELRQLGTQVVKKNGDEIAVLSDTSKETAKNWIHLYISLAQTERDLSQLLPCDAVEKHTEEHKKVMSEIEVIRPAIENFLKSKQPRKTASAAGSGRSVQSGLVLLMIEDERRKAEAAGRLEMLKKKQELDRQSQELDRQKEELDIQTELAVQRRVAEVTNKFKMELDGNPEDVIDTAEVLSRGSDLQTSLHQMHPSVAQVAQETVPARSSHPSDPGVVTSQFSQQLHEFQSAAVLPPVQQSNQQPSRPQQLSRHPPEFQPVAVSLPDFHQLDPHVPEFHPADGTQAHVTQAHFPPQHSSSSELLSGLAQLLSEETKRSSLPALEPDFFQGNPEHFHLWIRSFETYIESRTSSPTERLHYLSRYTKGDAREAIQGFLHLKSQDAYAQAKAKLQDRYGSSFATAQSYRRKIKTWPKIAPGDDKGLQKFVDYLESCEVASRSVTGLGVLSDPDENVRMLQLLPKHIVNRWEREVDEALHPSRPGSRAQYPSFGEFVHFLKKEARVASGPIGMRLKESAHSSTRPQPKTDPAYSRRQTSHPARGSSFATEAVNAGSPRKSRQDHGSQSQTEAVNTGSPRKPSQDHGSQSQRRSQGRACYFCMGDHLLHYCDSFQEKDMDTKKKFIKEKRLCFGCLGTGHIALHCQRKGVCKVCKKRHLTVLHENRPDQPPEDEVEPSGVAEQESVQASSAHVSSNSRGHLGCMNILPVNIYPTGEAGKGIQTYAFLDNGSSASFISSSLLTKLDVPSAQRSLALTTVSGEKILKTQVTGGLELSDMAGTTSIPLPPLYTLDSLPVSREEIPRQSDVDDWPHLKGVWLPEASLPEDMEVGLLIGYNCPEALQPLEVVRSEEGGPYAVRTTFGWTIAGPKKSRSEDRNQHTANVHRIQVDSTQMIKDMYNAEFGENMASTELGLSQEDRLWQRKMEESVTMKDGHYQLALPLKHEDVKMPNNRKMAEQRLAYLKKKMDKHSEYAEDYVEFMEGIIREGYAEKVPESRLGRTDQKVWYIPHHGVYHAKKPGKIRVVFDCAARCGDVGLNDMLLQGPDLTNNLLGVLLRFRQGEVALMADVKAMFHQVQVPEEDRDYLRFLWWPDGNRERAPTEYRMTVHLFGAVSSPSCANFALRKAAEDNVDKYSQEAVDVILKNFYVDDCLKSVGTEEEAREIVRQVRGICSEGGFNLTKFVANRKAALQDLPAEDCSQKRDIGLGSEAFQSEERALGVRWNIDEDKLGFSISRRDMPMTRRGILSIISSVYDPLGIAGPFLLRGKQILQDLCRKEIGWDDSIPSEEAKMWKKWLEELPKLSEVTVDRCLRPPDFGCVVQNQLHHFSDASEKGYGAVSYLRQVNKDGKVHCAFLMAKSRVAPLKKFTVPRLELSAATLSVRQNATLQRELDKVDVHETFFWTDSTAVLRYVNNDKARYQTFVANRLAIIKDGSTASQWRYVASQDNPADDASRAYSDCDALRTGGHWLDGPEFLREDESRWPQMPFNTITAVTEEDPEVKRAAVCTATVCRKEDGSPTDRLVKYFSSWYRLKKAVAWLLRAKKNLQKRSRDRLEGKKSGQPMQRDDTRSKEQRLPPLSPEELQDAEEAVIKYVQKQSFGEELAFLQSTDAQVRVKRSSRLRDLDPIVKKDVLRVGGRLKKSEYPYESRHPAILPKRGHVTELIIRDAHEKLGHQGREHVLAELRTRYWIISANSVVRSVLKKCVSCKRRQAPVVTQLMSDLPEDRVTPGDPAFTNVGVDYFGPFVVKVGRRREKRYGVIFTCLAVRAVHIEVANSLSTDSFINALRRFVARRGPVRSMRSDNGTNFVGAERELREEIEQINQFSVHEAMLKKGIDWKFNPPGASHFGGVWERQIRTVRKILGAVLKEQVVDDECLNTLLCEVESIINSRPLTYVSSDTTEALTPNHFLHLRGGAADAPGVFTSGDVYRRRWRHVQYLADLFWKRWVREYVPMLQRRQKWVDVQKNLSVDDVVLVVGEGSRGQWKLGRIKDTFQDGRGLVRKAIVRVGHSEYLRPVSKLISVC